MKYIIIGNLQTQFEANPELPLSYFELLVFQCQILLFNY